MLWLCLSLFPRNHFVFSLFLAFHFCVVLNSRVRRTDGKVSHVGKAKVKKKVIRAVAASGQTDSTRKTTQERPFPITTARKPLRTDMGLEWKVRPSQVHDQDRAETLGSSDEEVGSRRASWS